MSDDYDDSLFSWDEIAIGWGNLFLPILTKMVDWLDRILKAVVEILGGKQR